MTAGLRISHAILGVLFAACLAGTVSAESLGTEWKDVPFTDTPFSGVRFSDDGNMVFATGDQLLLRSWDGQKRWGGRSGAVAALSGNGEFVADGIGTALILLDKTMVDNWTRNQNGQVKAVAISGNASFVFSADDQGNYNTWARNGEFLGRTTDDVVIKMVFSPAENIVVATTMNGLRAWSPVFIPLWSDNTTGSILTDVIISQDGSTIIASGGNRLLSYSSKGQKNWEINPSSGAIIDTACNRDCSLIVVGTQDSTIVAIDRYGKTRWTYKAGQWINGVDVSKDASVIAAGGLDGTVYLLNRAGDVTTKKKIGSNLRPQSIAISPDGRRVAVADLTNLYGLSVLGDASPGVMETFTLPPLDPVRAAGITTQPTTVAVTATAAPDTPAEEITALPTPSPTTQKSDAGILPVLGAWAAIVFAIWVIKR